MPIVREENVDKYMDKQEFLAMQKYGSSIYLPKGRSIYLPKSGGSFMDFVTPVMSFLKDNKEVITTGINAASSIAKTEIDIAKGTEEIKAIREGKMRRQHQNGTGVGFESSMYPNYNLTGTNKRSKNHQKINDLGDKIIAESSKEGKGFQIIE